MRAVAKFVRIAPRKARLVANEIRGRSYPEVVSLLRFTNKRAAKVVGEVVNSAAANAEHNSDADTNELRVKTVRVDEGPTIKRYRPRAMGRATMIRKRTSHITVELEPPVGAPVTVDTPEGFRLGVKRKGEKVDFKSNWYSDKDFAELLGEDLKIREHIEKKLSRAGIANITIRKAAEQGEVAVDIHTARPGIVIGKGGSEVDALRGELERLTGKRVQVNVREVSRPELNAALVAESIAEQLEGRAAFRRTMKRALTSAMRSGAEGARIQCGGRLGGIEMSRSETISEGRVPLHTLDADIDYGFREAETQMGQIGVKVWVNHGVHDDELSGGR
jgi:small subunit ribosomal protein S3